MKTMIPELTPPMRLKHPHMFCFQELKVHYPKASLQSTPDLQTQKAADPETQILHTVSQPESQKTHILKRYNWIRMEYKV